MTTAGARLGVFTARLAYVVVLAIATLAPFDFRVPADGLARGLGNAFTFRYTLATAVDAVQNVLLFAGWGALWVTTGRPEAGARARGIRLSALTGAAMSIVAEALQLFLPDRRASVLDVITNTAGAALGAAAIVIAVGIAAAMRRQKSYIGLPAVGFAIAYLSAAVTEAMLPLQETAVIATRTGSQLRRLRLVAPQIDWHTLGHVPPADILLFFPLGVFGVMALVESGKDRWAAARQISAWGALGAALLELTHGPLGQPIQPGTAVAHLAGVALGAAACGLWLPAFSRRVRGRGRPALVLVAYAMLIAFWAWRPFVIETDPAILHQQFSPERLIPLYGLAGRSDLASVAEIVKPFFLFFPLGALLAVWPLRRNGVLGFCLPALYLAAATEATQGFISGRFFDGTDLVIQCAAAAIGWAVVRQAGYEPHGTILG